MEFTDEAIDEFIAIYERNFNEPISRGDAIEMASRLVNMYRLFLRPMPPAVAAEMKRREELKAKEESNPSSSQAA